MSCVLVDGYDEQLDDGEWERREERTLLSYIESINAEAATGISAIAPWMKMGRSETADTSYLANHCEACGALQGDWFLSKLDHAFFPQDLEAARRLAVRPVAGHINVEASLSWSSWHDWLALNDSDVRPSD
ncbi:MAG: hypothetical protein J0I77_02105 [Rudaea sp.]|uniref:hypothetical protein n=1 Tax=unclassified Rudaea TaxID=2627037 RepID=UPI0010F7D869|nr:MULTISPECIES: hypothetical protein [unclassified Rudaea]MBN8884489.1 hypothetical protein [Rudaea sp.]